MQMHPVIAKVQRTEARLQRIDGRVITGRDHQSETMMSMLITILYTGIDKIAQAGFDITPVRWNQYGDKQASTDVVNERVRREYTGMIGDAYVFKDRIGTVTTQAVTHKAFDLSPARRMELIHQQ
jgi:hypothetical protein